MAFEHAVEGMILLILHQHGAMGCSELMMHCPKWLDTGELIAALARLSRSNKVLCWPECATGQRGDVRIEVVSGAKPGPLKVSAS